MTDTKPKVLLTFRIGGENGGPFISHKRIMESALTQKYDIKPLMLENPRKMRKPKIFFETVKRIKSEKPEFVHMTGLGSEGFFTMLACRLARVKTLVAVHGSATEAIGFGKISNIIFNIMENYTVKKATAVYGVSDYVSSWEICKRSKNYCGTVYNIPSFSESKTGEQYIRKSLGIADGDIVVASTGRITKDKGFDDLWEVIKQLKDYPHIKFVIAGDGEYRNEWLSQVKESGFENRVFLLGYRSDIDAILRESDIFIICTKHETLCISLLEAANKSLPLIASNVGGIPEIIKNGENGILAEVGDINSFKNAVIKLTENKELRDQMGAKSRLKMDTIFSEAEITNKLDDIYKSVIWESKC